MIVSVEGILDSRGDNFAIVNISGLGFRVYMPTSTLSRLGASGDRVRLHTHLKVKEDSIALYGFASTEELGLFEMLIGVAGVGPKIALALLSELGPERLPLAIASGSTELLTSAPGVGKKMAARLALELKGKLEQVVPSPGDAEVAAVLTSLGYSAAEVSSAIAALADSFGLALEDKVKLALQHLARG